MENFVTFMRLTLSNISAFLMGEPLIYFVGLVLLACVIKILSSFMRGLIR